MTTITFDTHFFIKKLVNNGLSEKQAEAVVDFVREVKEGDLNIVATKADLQILKNDLQILDSKLENKIMETKISLIQWMVGLLFLQAGLIVALVKLL